MNQQYLFIKRNHQATLYKIVNGDRMYTEGPRLLTDFYVGRSIRVGSMTARTFDDDWWQTSNIVKITSVIPQRFGDYMDITFNTSSGSTYVLAVPGKSIEYRDDLQPLVDLTGTIGTDDWFVEAKAFNRKVNNEYKKRIGEAESKRKEIREKEKATDVAARLRPVPTEG